MKLNKKTRKALYEAAPKTTEIIWPQDAPEPSWGHRYPIYTDEGNYAFTVRLEASHKGSYETTATVRIDSDPTRVLPGLQGVRTEAGDYETEPEQVGRKYQARISMLGAAKTARYSGERTLEAKRQSKEARAGSESRSERAVKRHQKAAERAKVEA